MSSFTKVWSLVKFGTEYNMVCSLTCIVSLKFLLPVCNCYLALNTLALWIDQILVPLFSMLFSFILKPLAAWDVPYLTNKAKRKWLNVSGKQYAPYFPLGGCMEGLSNLFNCLFGISLVPEGTKHGEVWSPEVYKLAGKSK